MIVQLGRGIVIDLTASILGTIIPMVAGVLSVDVEVGGNGY